MRSLRGRLHIALMRHSNSLDDLFLVLSSQRNLRHKLRLLRNLYHLRRAAAKGIRDDLSLLDYRFSFLSTYNAELLFTEIFVAEPYRFTTQSKSPLIIDGGVNVGVSVAYFKWLYPDSRIIGFEPTISRIQGVAEVIFKFIYCCFYFKISSLSPKRPNIVIKLNTAISVSSK